MKFLYIESFSQWESAASYFLLKKFIFLNSPVYVLFKSVKIRKKILQDIKIQVGLQVSFYVFYIENASGDNNRYLFRTAVSNGDPCGYQEK